MGSEQLKFSLVKNMTLREAVVNHMLKYVLIDDIYEMQMYYIAYLAQGGLVLSIAKIYGWEHCTRQQANEYLQQGYKTLTLELLER